MSNLNTLLRWTARCRPICAVGAAGTISRRPSQMAIGQMLRTTAAMRVNPSAIPTMILTTRLIWFGTASERGQFQSRRFSCFFYYSILTYRWICLTFDSILGLKSCRLCLPHQTFTIISLLLPLTTPVYVSSLSYTILIMAIFSSNWKFENVESHR